MGKKLDLVGQKFNRLLVKKFVGVNKWKHSCWRCVCDCENEVIVVGKEITSGHTKSCGCLKIEKFIERSRKSPSEETKRKISESRKGKCVGKDNHNYGKHHTIEVRKKMSISKKGKNCGKNNPNYNPNLTDEDRIRERHIPGYAEWRKAVYERDNYTCQICGSKKSGNFVAHHLESYRANPKLRITLSNGTTTCENCHLDFHHQYGYGNNTRKQFEKFKKEYK